MSAFDRQKWDAKYQQGEFAEGSPSKFFLSVAHHLPAEGSALDLAGGTGRHAIWLAQRGLDVTLADVSAVGLQIAGQKADDAGVSLRTLEIDLEEDPLPSGRWDVVLSSYFLRRPLLQDVAQLLSPGGLFLFLHATRTNLTRHAKPPEEFLLKDGELPGLIAGLEIVEYHEGWTGEGRHEARLVATRR